MHLKTLSIKSLRIPLLAFIHSPKTEWEVSGGGGFSYKQFFSVEVGEQIENTTPGLGIGAKYDTEVTD
jgi:hypothetical protein